MEQQVFAADSDQKTGSRGLPFVLRQALRRIIDPNRDGRTFLQNDPEICAGLRPG
jgi:hypothetical protein